MEMMVRMIGDEANIPVLIAAGGISLKRQVI